MPDPPPGLLHAARRRWPCGEEGSEQRPGEGGAARQVRAERGGDARGCPAPARRCGAVRPRVPVRISPCRWLPWVSPPRRAERGGPAAAGEAARCRPRGRGGPGRDCPAAAAAAAAPAPAGSAQRGSPPASGRRGPSIGGAPSRGKMLPGSIQISGETLSGAEIRDICESLRENSVRLLSLRGCQLSERDFGHVCRGVAESRSLAQLNLNLGIVSNINRVKQLAEALKTNRSVQSLFLHGSPLTDAGLALLNPALSIHPSLVALDLGDCMLGDEGINLICGLLPPDGAKSGLKELTLSANPGITSKGWGRLAIAVAHSSQLRVLNLDYNPLGDQVAGMLAVAVASSRTLEVLDLEGTGLTNQSAQTLLDMVENYPTALRTLILAENNISPELQQQISDLLSEGEEEEETEAHEVTAREKNPWICQNNSSSQMVLMTSGLGDSLLAETEM
uniref:Leucine rich repeat containing 73 n=77 Tax=Neoaves TaxID=3078114 RepID=A0A8C3VCG3_CATUS